MLIHRKRSLSMFCFLLLLYPLWTVLHQESHTERVGSAVTPYSSGTPVSKDINKVTHIGFLKVHKAASTTMQNMFFRFGLKHRLNILLPVKGNYVLDNTPLIELSHVSYYDVLAIHTVYKKSTFKKWLPSDAVYIGIVREPLERMISAAYYYRDISRIKYLRQIPRSTFIHELITQPETYDKRSYSMTRNSMARDFGFSKSMLTANASTIRRMLDELKNEFLLVLVVEKLDESLVLMKRYLNWEMADIIYMKANANRHSGVRLTEDEKAKFQSTCFLDFAIYDEFKAQLDGKLSLERNDFWLEVAYFKNLLSTVSKFCSKKNPFLFVPRSQWNDEFYVLASDCTLMKTHERRFVDTIRRQMLHERQHTLHD